MENLVKINLHGHLGKAIREEWNLAVSSVSEALRAIDILSGRKFFAYLAEKDRRGAYYQVLINDQPFKSEEPLTIEKPENFGKSELSMKIEDLKSIDIVPLLEGSQGGKEGGILGAILGIILIIVGIVLLPAGIGGVLLVAGIGILAAGIIVLLSSPPKFEDFREIDGTTGRTSYLFNGPENITGEGGPVPIGYGRLMVGSQVIAQSFVIQDVDANNTNAVATAAASYVVNPPRHYEP